MRAYTNSLIHSVVYFTNLVLRFLTSSLAPLVSSIHGPATGDRQVCLSNHIKPGFIIFPAFSFSAILQVLITLIPVPVFLSIEHCGGGEVHPGPDEPNARLECLLQPVS